MRELTRDEVNEVTGGINGYQAAGAIMATVAFGAMFTPIGAIVGGIALGSTIGLASAQFLADVSAT